MCTSVNAFNNYKPATKSQVDGRSPTNTTKVMSKNIMESTGDSWKEVASVLSQAKGSPQASEMTRRMIARMNELSPFAEARGILDNGCGGGALISHILSEHGAEIRPTATIAAGDFSEPMLDAVREAREARIAEGKPGWERLKVKQLDAHDLSDIGDRRMTHVTGGHLYFLLTDYRKALKETYRVLDKGGVLAISGGKESQHLDALHDAVEAVRPGRNLQMIQEPWASEAGVKNELEVAGFVEVETFVVAGEMKYEKHADFAKMLMAMPVMKNVVEDYSEDEKERVLVELQGALRKKNSAEPGVLTGTSIVALGRVR